jgi:predicted nucleotidyltransferase
MTIQDRMPIIQDMADKIIAAFSPERIILFGSYAWGKPGPDSDIDFFIIKDTNDTRKTSRKINRLLFPRETPIDVIVFTPQELEKRKNDFFVEDILKKGKTLYARA